MREIPVSDITEAVARLCVEANRSLPADLEASIVSASQREENALGRSILCDLCENLSLIHILEEYGAAGTVFGSPVTSEEYARSAALPWAAAAARCV